MRTAKKRTPSLRLVDGRAPTDTTDTTDTYATHGGAIPATPFRLVLVFNVDGKPVAGVPFDLVLPDAPDGQLAQLQVGVDGRQLAKMLAPYVAQADAKAQAVKLWTPGQAH